MGKVRVTRAREVNTYAEMWHGSLVMRHTAEGLAAKSYFKIMASLIFAAFSLEAFLNHVGAHLFSSWDELERLPPLGKLKVISEKLRISLDHGSRPIQTAVALLKFRNELAHGKTSRILLPEKVEEEPESDELLFTDAALDTDWEKFCNAEQLKRVHEDLDKLFRDIHSKSKMPGVIFSMGLRSSHGVYVPDTVSSRGDRVTKASGT